MNTETLKPQDMNWHQNGVLGIDWSDGHKGVYPVRHLRQHCPCAGCIDEWSGELRLDRDSIPLLIALEDIEAVGHYAFRVKWSDGHDTGIYSYALLRRLCQCDECQPEKPDKPRGKVLL